ncbi:uncharacterized protein LOC143012261 [Genypterus blacodes]|uniref:uncharacterized protein LOC143012261 n=1 Tax=Genypterus blacodes TaxID=154954 RepID=UPI003F75749B
MRINLWLPLAFFVLTECRYQRRSTSSCPILCSCSYSEVVCNQSSLTEFPKEGLPANIIELSIQSTNLSLITSSQLSVVPHLTKLQLYHNNLHSLPSDLLQYVPNLTRLDLTGNQLVHLPQGIFSHACLSSLVLKNNRIEKADAKWFADNSSLTSLDLAGNNLTDVSPALFQKLPYLESLDLSDNNLQELQSSTFQHLHRLKSLTLAKNKLTSLKPTTFTHNYNLSQLYLQQNQLQELPGSLLLGLQHLEVLSIFQNQLQYLPSGLLDDGPFSLVILSQNPWVCDQKMEYLWKWLSPNPMSVFLLEEVTCARPESLKDRQVISLKEAELGLNKSDSK